MLPLPAHEIFYFYASPSLQHSEIYPKKQQKMLFYSLHLYSTLGQNGEVILSAEGLVSSLSSSYGR
jgi:hypothetical protein